MNRFLIIYPGALGDILLTCPVLFLLKKTIPNCCIDYVGNPEYLYLLKNEINNIYDYQSVKLLSIFSPTSSIETECQTWLESYDCIIFWSSRFEAFILKKLKALKNPFIIYDSLTPPKNYSEHLINFMLKTLKPFGIKFETFRIEDLPQLSIPHLNYIKSEKVIVHPGSGSYKKNLPIQTYKKLMDMIKQSLNLNITCILGPAEENIYSVMKNGNWDLETLQSMNKLCSILKSAKYYIGNDSGVTHLAVQLGINTTAIFVSTNPVIWAPIGNQINIIHDQKRLKGNRNFHYLHNLSAENIFKLFSENIKNKK